MRGGKPTKSAGNKSPERKEVISYSYVRDRGVAADALIDTKGICYDCKKKGPFISRKTNQPFLEVHHVKMLRDHGSDTPDNVIALCPNCHRKRHDGLARE